MCTVPPIFSSRSVSSVGARIASLRPNANSPSVRAPSSVSSAARRNASPLAASASTQRPASKRRRAPSTRCPPQAEGIANVTTPSVASSRGPVKTSPSGRLW